MGLGVKHTPSYKTLEGGTQLRQVSICPSVKWSDPAFSQGGPEDEIRTHRYSPAQRLVRGRGVGVTFTRSPRVLAAGPWGNHSACAGSSVLSSLSALYK